MFAWHGSHRIGEHTFPCPDPTTHSTMVGARREQIEEILLHGRCKSQAEAARVRTQRDSEEQEGESKPAPWRQMHVTHPLVPIPWLAPYRRAELAAPIPLREHRDLPW